VGKEAMEKAVDIRKNLLLENPQAMVLAACCMLEYFGGY
jgi:hypothetical protein